MSRNWFSYNVSGNFAGNFRFRSTADSRENNVSGTVSAARRTEHVTSDASGTTVRTTSQNLGERPVSQVRRYDAAGREIAGAAGAAGAGFDRRIEDVTDREPAEQEKKQ